MPFPIEAILFDVGGTLRSSAASSEVIKLEKVREIRELIGADTPVEELAALLTSRGAAYRRWAREKWIELDEAGMWTQWLLPEYPAAQIRNIALQLNRLWRQATGVREVFPETRDVLLELFRRGYRIGIVSNTVSTTEAPELVKKLEISGIPEVVILSGHVGIRKPDPRILLDATRRMGIEPGKCVYIGDRHDRDILAATRAGFGGTVLINSPHPHAGDVPDAASPAADHYIGNLQELLDIFPALPAAPAPPLRYNASCSTMWARHSFPSLADFIEACRRMGFEKVELNHQVDSGMLEGLDLARQPLSSVHEPCPADVPVEELKARDWLMSSPDEDCRQRGVQAIKHSIDLARSLHLPVIVVHAGMVSTDMVVEQRLRRLYEAGQAGSTEYQAVKQELIDTRSRLLPACFASTKKSLRELLDYADGSGIRLGLENRYHYYDIPSLDEMGELLALADETRLGFVYDVGHAEHLSRLGFYAHEEWLRRYSHRILETHLHDVKGLQDHQAPGFGEIDFGMVARYLPKDAIRTLELQHSNSPEQVRAGLACLAQHGCLTAL